MTDDPRRFAETLGSGEEVHAHWGGRASDVHEKCRKEIERLRELAYLLIDELRFNGGYEAYTPKMLFDEFYEQAVRGE